MKKPAPKALRTKIIWRGNDKPTSLLLPLEQTLEAQRRDCEQADRQVAKELNDKLHLLAAFRGVDTKSPMWEFKLCLILAADLYPGFRVETNPVGRPKEWDFLRYARLLCDVEKTKRSLQANRSGTVTDSQALSALIKRCIASKSGAYRPSKGQSESALLKTLKNKLVEATDREKNPVLWAVWDCPDVDARKAMLDQIVPRLSSPEKD